MTTYDEWLHGPWGKLSQETEYQHRAAQARAKMALRAAVDAQHLTADMHWNEFLTYVTATLEETNRNIASYQDMFMQGAILSPEAYYESKIGLSKAQGIKEALEWVIELPKALIEQGKIVRELYDEEDN